MPGKAEHPLVIQDLLLKTPSGRLILDIPSLSLSCQGLTVISGPNGSGKSMLLRCIFGLESFQGRIHYHDQKHPGDPRPIRRDLALVFQDPEHQILGLTVREELELSRASQAKVRRPEGSGVEHGSRDLATLSKACGLEDLLDSPCGLLSGGERRRLALASALAMEAQTLVLDEPFNDLDWEGAHRLLLLLLELLDQGKGIWLVTHDLEKCLAHADRLLVLNQGKVQALDHPRLLWPKLPAWGLRIPMEDPQALAAMTWLKPQVQR